MTSRLPTSPVNDYDLDSLKKIKVRDFTYYVMPRYLEHYTMHEYEPFSADLWSRYIQPGDTVADVGGHFGFYSLLAARFAGESGQVIALEPVPENSQVLAKNAAANNLQDIVTVRHAAASNKNGSHSFNVPWASDSAGFYEHPNAATLRTINVETVNLDTLLAGKKVSMVKIDTEGHEIAVLDGADEFFKANPQVRLLVEFNPNCLITASHKPVDLLKALQKRGFAIYIIDENNRRLDRVSGRLDQWEALMNGREYANLLCLPGAETIDMTVISHVSEIAGGAELTLATELEALQQRNVVTHVVLPSHGSLEARLKELAISYQIIPMYSWERVNSIKPGDLQNQDYVNTRAVESLYQLFARRQPQIVCSNTMVMPWGAVAASAARIPHIWNIHEFGDIDHGNIFDYPYDQVLNIINLLSQRVKVVSKAVKTHVARVIPASKMTVVYLRAPAPAHTTADYRKHRIFKDATAFKMVLPARIVASKGQLQAVEAAKELVAKGHNIELRLVGRVQDKAYLKEVKDYIRSNDLAAHVSIDNFTNKAYEYFEEADAVLVCSRNEAFGRVTSEGQQFGKIVIATRSGATTEMIEDGKTGLLYDPGDSKALAKQLEFAIKHPKQALQIAQAGQDSINDLMSEANTNGKLYYMLRDVRDNPQPAAPLFFEKFIPRFSQIISDQEVKTQYEMTNSNKHQAEVANLMQELATERQKFMALRKVARHPVVRGIRKTLRK